MYGGKSFASPYRSTVPLVCLFKDDRAKFDAIGRTCGGSSEFSIHFEYKVFAPGSSGGPSQSDAMLFANSTALALEAKWTEPRYPKLSTRLSSRVAALTEKNPAGGADFAIAEQTAIKAWLDLLARHSKALDIESSSNTIYQMVHRAASACGTAHAPRLAYLHFSPSNGKAGASHEDYKSDLKYLHSLMGSPAGFPFYLVEMPLEPTAAFRQIQNLKKGQDKTDTLVRDAIRSSRLFEFGEPRIEKIGAEIHRNWQQDSA
jgi:hypothetical protein